jgi:hypothetical protein
MKRFIRNRDIEVFVRAQDNEVGRCIEHITNIELDWTDASSAHCSMSVPMANETTIDKGSAVVFLSRCSSHKKFSEYKEVVRLYNIKKLSKKINLRPGDDTIVEIDISFDCSVEFCE